MVLCDIRLPAFGISNQFQLGHIFEYKNEQAMKDCLPIWNDIERQFKDKIPNIAVGYRGILLDQYKSKT